MVVEIFLDCGAPSLYNMLSKKKKKDNVMGTHIKSRRDDDFSYVQTPEYKKYRRDYAKFVKSLMPVLSAYPNLDVINNAELTYKNQKLLEKKGLRPCPVWHFGSDVKWLRRYIKEGYDYICIGGMVPNHTRVLQPALDKLWIDELTDKDGMPIVKIHGFAMTSFDLMYRYPWYSVDSKSWIDYARFGRVLVPMPKDGKLDWLHPEKIAVSSRSLTQSTTNRQIHLNSMSTPKRKYVLKYFEKMGIPLGKSKYKKVDKGYKPILKKEVWFKKDEEVEVLVEKGITNANVCRMDANIIVYRKIEELIPAWPWSVYDTVNPKRIKGLF